jgi:hypothetical protein
MSSLGVDPAPESIKKDFSWKQLFIKAAGFGVGFALMLVALAGAGLWYSNRPKPPKPWNRTAVTASYQHVRSLEETAHYEFWYVLDNHTDEDFRISDPLEIEAEAQIDSNVLSMCSDCVKLRYPIFIPAQRSLQIPVEFTYVYPNAKVPKNAEERKQEIREIEDYLRTEMPRLTGFVLFDRLHRYEIDLNSGWKNKSQDTK